MNKDLSVLIQFDLLLARSDKKVFSNSDLEEILSRLSSKYLERKYCFDWFLDNNILINSEQEYYYTGEKIQRYKPYKGYQRIVKIIKERDGLPIEFDFINFKIE
jgi:hypothetical protein